MSILVSYDGSDNANLALHYAITMAKAYQEDLILLHVQHKLETYNTKRFFNQDEIINYQNELGNEVLSHAESILSGVNIAYKTLVRFGNPKTEISQLAKELNVHSIVMGSRGMDPLIGKILGSVSYGVLFQAPCPVVIVPPK